MYGVGEEPDPRFSLANERTALAWSRTALAMVAGAAALTSIGQLHGAPNWTPLVGALIALSGGLLVISALVGWARTERALRQRQPLPAPATLPILVAVIALCAAVTGVLAVAQFFR